ncbi:MAG TPA: hypothetical protein VN577_14685 [Terriglobales bacterium]|jgi:hypothetical protein|nr:hypothetical protein [Terriglobales bacterium]
MLNLKELAEEYGVRIQVWPRYVSVNGERRQDGFDLELLGSHTIDPTHLDPSCTLCQRAAVALLRIAQQVTCDQDHPTQSGVRVEICPHEMSLVCSPRLENRPLVIVTINIFRRSEHIEHANEHELDVLNTLKKRLAELSIHEL